MAFVLDKHKQPLMPCTPKRARQLLAQGRAVVVRVQPFVIRLKDRLAQDSVLQPLALKLDPGSKITGIDLEKTHAYDALCVGALAGVRVGPQKTLRITAMGRGTHCRTLWTKKGFPRAYLMRQKMVKGFATGDRIKACVPAPYKAKGTHIGRVTVRKTGRFAVQTALGKVDNIYARFCHLVQRADGYDYALCSNNDSASPPLFKKECLLLPLDTSQESPQAEDL
jgi:hypothetical protein